jgi:hypothetical protein
MAHCPPKIEGSSESCDSHRGTARSGGFRAAPQLSRRIRLDGLDVRCKQIGELDLEGRSTELIEP